MCSQLARSPTTDSLLLLAFQKREIIKAIEMLFQARPSPTHQHTYLTDDPLSFTFRFFQNILLHEQVFNLTKKKGTPSFWDYSLPKATSHQIF